MEPGGGDVAQAGDAVLHHRLVEQVEREGTKSDHAEQADGRGDEKFAAYIQG
jgi:hypothetical protein